MFNFPSFNLFIHAYRKKKPNAVFVNLLILYIFLRIQSDFRRERFTLFLDLIKQINKPIEILDIGGTVRYWYYLGYTHVPGITITILNIYKQKSYFKNIKIVSGDARNLKNFKDKQFDIIYSNSLIEHLSNYNEQSKLAKEIRRIGKKYYIQTPNKYFFIEPHFLIPFFYLIPNSLKPIFVKLFSIKWWLKPNKIKDIRKWIDSIRLLDKKEMTKLFSDGIIYEERFLLFTKSYIAYK